MGRYAWEVYATYGGKPAGFVSRHRTHLQALVAATQDRMTCRVKREHLSDEDYDHWARSGYPAKCPLYREEATDA
jgi:hypothetical protein